MAERIYSPSPTVRGSRIPLYLRGIGPLLGDDGIDTTSIDLPDNPVWVDPTQFQIPQLAPILDNYPIPGLETTSIPNLDNVTLTPPQIPTMPTLSPAQSSSAAAQIAAAIASGAKGILSTTGPSPRIATTPIPGVLPGSSMLTKSSIIKGIPDIAVIGLGLVLLLAAGGKR